MLDDKEKDMLLNNTIKKIFKNDPYNTKEWREISKGGLIINRSEDLFYQFDINKLLSKYLEKRITQSKIKKGIFFFSRSYELPKLSGKVKIIRLNPAFHQEPKIKLSINDIYTKFGQNFIAPLFLSNFFYSLYSSKNTNDGHSTRGWIYEFEDYLEKTQEADIDKIVDKISKLHAKYSYEHESFTYVSRKYKLKDYFGISEENLFSILDENDYIIFEIESSSMFDNEIYSHVLNLYLFLVIQYYRLQDKKFSISIDDIFPFIALNKYKNENRLSEMTAEIFRSLNRESVYNLDRDHDYKGDIDFYFILFTGKIRKLGDNFQEISYALEDILNLVSNKIIFEIDPFFFKTIQESSSIPMYFLSSLIKNSEQVKDFWEKKLKVFPVIVGDYENHILSNEINLNEIPIDFRTVHLDEKLLFRITESENGNIEFKSEYKSCIKKILEDLVEMLNKKGGNIILGIKEHNSIKKYEGIDIYNNEGFKGGFDKLKENLFQHITDKIFQIEGEKIDIDELIHLNIFKLYSRDFITITIFTRKNLSFELKNGKNKRRIDSISTNS